MALTPGNAVDPGPHESIPPIHAQLFGQVVLTLGDRQLLPSDFPRRSARTLLLLLLATPGHSLPRDQIIDKLWPEATADTSRNALYLSLHALRRVLEPGEQRGRSSSYITAEGETIFIRPVPGCVVDVDAFWSAISDSRQSDAAHRRVALRRAVSWYAGDLLNDEPYQDWPVLRREALRRAWEQAVLELAQLDIDAGEPRLSIENLERLVQSDELLEEAHRMVMRVFAESGQIDLAIRQYDRCVAILQEHLGEDPDESTVMLYESLKTRRTSLRASPESARKRFHILPIPPTALIGRDRELEVVRDLVMHRLTKMVTLSGLGGIGKTHLALTVAAAVADDFTDGVLFVSLSAVSDPDLVLPTIAHAIGIRDDGQQTPVIERLAQSLVDRELLLILDNFEQIIDAAAAVAELLSVAPRIKVLVTSREALRIRGEHEVEVPPLETFDPGLHFSLESAERNEAIAMFVDRLPMHRSSPSISAENLHAIATICHRLEGIPLAIELAAAWAKHISLPELATRLSGPLDLPGGGLRDLPERHQTMRAAISWSYDLLAEPEQSLFRRLAVFSGGMSLSAMAFVFGHSADDELETTRLDPSRPVPSLQSALRRSIALLRNQSLLKPVAGTDSERYSFLETIRTFASEKLTRDPEYDVTARRHAAWFLAVARDAQAGFESTEQEYWVERFETDLDNIRAALFWSIEQRPQQALEIAAASGRFWELRGFLNEGQTWLERAISACIDEEAPAFGWALHASGSIAILRAEFEMARARMEQARAIAVETDDVKLLGRVTAALGFVHYHVGNYPLARELLVSAGEFSRTANDKWGVATAAIDCVFNSYFLGHTDDARIQMQQAVELAESAGDRQLMTRALITSGQLAAWTGDIDSAEAFLQRALNLTSAYYDRESAASANLRLGEVLGMAGDRDRAHIHLSRALLTYRDTGRAFQVGTALFYRATLVLPPESPETGADLREALRIWHQQGSVHVLDCLQGISRHYVHIGDAATALEICAAIAAHRERIGQPLRVDHFRRDFELQIESAQATLSPEIFTEIWTRGSALNLDQAILKTLKTSP